MELVRVDAMWRGLPKLILLFSLCFTYSLISANRIYSFENKSFLIADTKLLKTGDEKYYDSMKKKLGEEEFFRLINKDIGEDTYYRGRAARYVKKKDYKKAISILNEGINRNRESYKLYELRGVIRSKFFNDEIGSLDDFNKAIDLIRVDDSGKERLAMYLTIRIGAYNKLGDYEKACLDVKDLIKLKPSLESKYRKMKNKICK